MPMALPVKASSVPVGVNLTCETASRSGLKASSRSNSYCALRYASGGSKSVTADESYEGLLSDLPFDSHEPSGRFGAISTMSEPFELLASVSSSSADVGISGRASHELLSTGLLLRSKYCLILSLRRCGWIHSCAFDVSICRPRLVRSSFSVMVSFIAEVLRSTLW